MPEFLIEPVPQRVVAGHTLRLLASASPVSAQIQWFRDGERLEGVAGSSLRIENAGVGDVGFYKAMAIASGGASWSTEVFVDVITNPPAPGVLDRGFFIPGMDGVSVDAILPLADGRVVLGGNFQIGGVPHNLAVLDAEGNLDPNFNLIGKPDGRVWAMALSLGRLLVAGDFTLINGVPCGGIAALELDTGQLDPSWDHSLGFVPGTLPVRRVLCLEVAEDGSVFAGGTFTHWRTPGGTRERPLLIALDPGGVPRNDFSPALVEGGEVRDLARLAAGELAVVGSFTEPSQGFTVLDTSGAMKHGFALSDAPNARVRAVVPLADGDFLIGGDFINVGGRLAKYGANGTLDPAFSLMANNDVNALAVEPDGKVLVAGVFNTLDDVPRRRLLRLNSDLTPDDSFRADGFDDEVNSLGIAGESIYVGGNFTAPHQLALKLYRTHHSPDGTVELVRAPLPRKAVVGSVLDLAVSVSPRRSDQIYYWTLDGIAIAQSDEPNLRVDRATAEEAGVYQVQVSDHTGSVVSPPVTVKIDQPLPGARPIFRYRGSPGSVMADDTTTTSLIVPDQFTVRHVRINLDIRHANTSDLEIYLVAPSEERVRLFNDNVRRGQDLRLTTFDDAAGGDAHIDDAQPPYTGTFRPNELLADFDGTNSAGTWSLTISNRFLVPGSLQDWSLELTADPEPVTLGNYLSGLGLAESDETSLSYALTKLPTGTRPGLRDVAVDGVEFSLGHWRWSAPEDIVYSYEKLIPGGWQPVLPSGISVTRFPGGFEWRQTDFPVSSSREIYRLKALIAPGPKS